MPVNASRELVQALSRCSHLILLNLRGNNLSEAGLHLIQCIRSWGEDSPLQKIYLDNCKLPAEISTELGKCLSLCKHLTLFRCDYVGQKEEFPSHSKADENFITESTQKTTGQVTIAKILFI